MPFNVLLLPLLGGYIFISYWNITRFDAKRYSGERLLFHAATAGIVLLAVSFVIVKLVTWWQPDLATWWRAQVPFPYAGCSSLALILGATAPHFLNVFRQKDTEARKVAQEWGDFLEMLLMKAMDEPKQVLITLKTGKVYVGFITRGIDPGYERK